MGKNTILKGLLRNIYARFESWWAHKQFLGRCRDVEIYESNFDLDEKTTDEMLVSGKMHIKILDEVTNQ